MDDLDRLLAALSEDTSDRGLRMVVSDALEERGRTEEANLLRGPAEIIILEGLIVDIASAIDHLYLALARATGEAFWRALHGQWPRPRHNTPEFIAAERIRTGDAVYVGSDGRVRPVHTTGFIS